MSVQRIELTAIAFDAGTQVRAALDSGLVAEYAEAMTAGEVFPAIVVFHDGNRYYLADGFHRYMAAQRVDLRDIDAEVRAGTKEDALWFALGANRRNGKRLNSGDKEHAIKVAVETFGQSKTQGEIAEQIGCSQGWVSQVISANNLPRPERVIGKDGKSRPASRKKTAPVADVPAAPRHAQHDAIAARLKAGETVGTITAALRVTSATVREVRIAEGLAFLDKSRAAVERRAADVCRMAGEGYSCQQIAESLDITEKSVRQITAQAGVEIVASRVMGRQRRLDSNRILDAIVTSAEHLTMDVGLLRFDQLDRARLGDWIDSLIQSRRALDSFIRQLTKEHKSHGEAA